MRRAALTLVAVAGTVAVVDLVHKAAAVAGRGDALALHERSATWALALGGLVLVELAAIALTRSSLLAFAGGVLIGGCAGNLLSVPLWDAVPDPIAAGVVATNLADVAIAAGALFLPMATAVVAWRERDRLREPVRLRPTR